jgi:cyclopropane fatty-acyl-phospholipid synthase-like methyltransferase
MAIEDREKIRETYDGAGEKEWERLERDPRGRVAFEVHRRFLSHYLQPSQHVLEIGAGPGRFTFVLAELGVTVDVTDFSPVQLDHNRARLEATDAERAVTSRSILDICDTSRYHDASFDAVVAYGGPLSYAFEEAPDAMTGLLRILKPSGVLIASVMSLLGSWRYFLGGVVEEEKLFSEEANDLVFDTGDMRHIGSGHTCQMFRSHEIVDLVESCGGEVLAMSASNWASLGDADLLSVLETDPHQWARFLDKEVRACAEPGAIDGGTHILFAARRRTTA